VVSCICTDSTIVLVNSHGGICCICFDIEIKGVSINRKLYLDDKTADICFLFETCDDGAIERIPAHKLILSTGSKVFERMFYGSIAVGNEVKIANMLLSLIAVN
jgi:hypothetical protein